MGRKLCDKCHKRKRVGEWRYCTSCLSWVRRAMVRDGYLTQEPKPRRRRDEKGRLLDAHDHD